MTPTALSPTTSMGAMARIGTVWLAMIHGIKERFIASLWRMSTARPSPSTVPKTNPMSVAESVIQAW